MQEHYNQFTALILGAVAGFIGFMFDVPAATLWTAAFGACLGLAFKPPTSLKLGIFLIVAGAAAVGWLVPFFTSEPPTFPQKSIAFVLALVIIGWRELIPNWAQRLGESVVNRLDTLIATWGRK